MSDGESPIEAFKRATAATVRAIAEREDVGVSFGAETPGAAGSQGGGPSRRVRLPLPSREVTAAEVAHLRGAADAAALRMRYHDDAVHARRMPSGETARAIFEAVEQARVEAIGSRRMAGVATNIAAMLEDRYRRQGYERITERSEATPAEA